MRFAIGMLLSLLATSAEASNLIWPDASSLDAGHGQVAVGGVVQPYQTSAGVEVGSGAQIGGRFALSDRISVRGSAFGSGNLPLTGGAVMVESRLFDEAHWRVSLYSGMTGATYGEAGPLVAAMVGTAFQANTERVVFDLSIPLYAVGMFDVEDGNLTGSGSELVLPLTSEVGVSAVLGDHRIRGGLMSLIPVVGYRYAPETGFTAQMDVGVLPSSQPSALVHLELGHRF